MLKQTVVAVMAAFVAGAAASASAQSLRGPRMGAKEARSEQPQLAHPVVAITFDDLPAVGTLPPGEDYVEVAKTLVSELKANHLEGTYGFVNGGKLASRAGAPEALRIWLDAGMNIGSHTWSHMRLTTNTVEAFEQDIAQDEPVLEQYGELRDWRWFRFPYLEEGETVEKRRAVRAYLSEHGYHIAQVTLQFEDYAWNDAYCRCRIKQDEAAIAKLRQSYLDAAAEDITLGREEEQLVFGREIPDVMLLHETPFTTLMLPDLLDLLRKQGFSFESLAQVESDPAYADDPDAGLLSGGTLLGQFMDSRHLPYPPAESDPFQHIDQLCQ
ncbi:MAG: polysaccharide deacetylase family protein [Terracidiphilus sp.]